MLGPKGAEEGWATAKAAAVASPQYRNLALAVLFPRGCHLPAGAYHLTEEYHRYLSPEVTAELLVVGLVTGHREATGQIA